MAVWVLLQYLTKELCNCLYYSFSTVSVSIMSRSCTIVRYSNTPMYRGLRYAFLHIKYIFGQSATCEKLRHLVFLYSVKLTSIHDDHNRS